MDVSLQPLFRAVPDDTTSDGDDPLKPETSYDVRKYKTVASRLEALFGTGDSPQLRRKLYLRIQRCAIEHGPECYESIRACVAAAQSADNPDRYFCSAVSRELKSLGYWENTTDF